MPPRVDIVLPVRNEAESISAVLEGLLKQAANGICHIYVLVAPSDDDTERICRGFEVRHPQTVVVRENPGFFVSFALNDAIDMFDAPFLMRVDGHTIPPANMVSGLLGAIEGSTFACVGPRIRTVGTTMRQQGIALAMSSRFGVGGSRFRTSELSMEVDTVAFGVYRREWISRAGRFREDLVRNQDSEYNLRLRERGGRIYMNAEVVVDYIPRSTFRGLWVQNYQYGFYRVLTMRAHPRLVAPRQLAPIALVIAIATAAVVAPRSRVPAISLAAAYAVLLGLLAAEGESRGLRRRAIAAGVFAAPVMQVAYGMGQLHQLARLGCSWPRSVWAWRER